MEPHHASQVVSTAKPFHLHIHSGSCSLACFSFPSLVCNRPELLVPFSVELGFSPRTDERYFVSLHLGCYWWSSSTCVASKTLLLPRNRTSNISSNSSLLLFITGVNLRCCHGADRMRVTGSILSLWSTISKCTALGRSTNINQRQEGRLPILFRMGLLTDWHIPVLLGVDGSFHAFFFILRYQWMSPTYTGRIMAVIWFV